MTYVFILDLVFKGFFCEDEMLIELIVFFSSINCFEASCIGSLTPKRPISVFLQHSIYEQLTMDGISIFFPLKFSLNMKR